MLNSKDLPEETQKELETLRHMQPADLNEDQMAFLRARRDYLTAEERITFGIDETAAKAASTEEQVEAPAKGKKTAAKAA